VTINVANDQLVSIKVILAHELKCRRE